MELTLTDIGNFKNGKTQLCSNIIVKHVGDDTIVIDLSHKTIYPAHGSADNSIGLENFLKQNNFYIPCIESKIREHLGLYYQQYFTSTTFFKEYKGIFAADTLLALNIELTYKCNEKCIHCYVGQNSLEVELDYNEWTKFFDSIKNTSILFINFTGGEIFTKPWIIDLLKYVRDNGFIVTLMTNGIGITDQQWKEINKLYIHSVSFSVYGSNSKIHDGITKIPGSFKKTMSAIKRSKDLGILTRANVIIMQKNFTDAQNIHDLLKSENIAYSYDISLFKSPNSTTLQLLNETDIKNVFKTLGVNTSVRGADEYICNAGRGDLSINPYGNIYPCHMFKEHLGNIKTDSILDIYRESEPAKNM